jgi:hypothetical protein
MRNDDAEMSRQVEAARRFPDGTVPDVDTQISLALYEGRLRPGPRAGDAVRLGCGIAGLKGSAASVWGNVAQSGRGLRRYKHRAFGHSDPRSTSSVTSARC